MTQLVLLLQIRDADDPMRQHEADSFRRVLSLEKPQLGTFDLLSGPLPESWINAASMILVGGSGKYSATDDARWLDVALDSLRLVHSLGTPTFASCWGFQAIARAMGGTVECRPEFAEVGSHAIQITNEGRQDPVFKNCGTQLIGQLGHEDTVTELPPGTTLLARTDRAFQAYRFDGLPVYCTQFHPELNKDDLVARLSAYPEYSEISSGQSCEALIASLQETPEATELLKTFWQHFVA